jgi:hypothetical protein
MEDHSAVSAYLYHYTSIDGLVGILGGQSNGIKRATLWATHCSFVNDRKELQYGHEVFTRQLKDVKAAVQARRHSGFPKPQYLHAFSDDLLQAMGNLEDTYLISFSGIVDDLSQWRAYCRGGGVCIGFPANELRAYVKLLQRNQEHVSSAEVVQCQYDEGAALKIMNELANRLASPKPLALLESDSEALDNARQGAARVCLGLKHPSFAAEREERIILRAPKHRQCFRTGSGRIVPYVEVPLPEYAESDFWRLFQVWVGPGRHSNLVYDGMQRLLSTKGLDKAKVFESGTPFRDME